jgi:hypothetical protein
VSTATTIRQFALYGPLIGGAPIFMLIALQELNGRRWSDASPAILWPAYIFFSYLYGIMPALITGFLLTKFRKSPSSLIRWTAQGTLAGAIVGFVIGCGVEMWLLGPASSRWPFLGVFLGAASAFSALCCSLLFRPVPVQTGGQKSRQSTRLRADPPLT